MAFTHGKNARLWMDQYELTSYFNDFTMAGKAGVAETTVYGVGAKTYIGGLKEGSLQLKGYMGTAATDTEDLELSGALGRNQNMALTFVPNGVQTAGTRAVVSYAAETDLQISAPVTGVIATSFGSQSDSGQATGVLLSDPSLGSPTNPIVTATTTNFPLVLDDYTASDLTVAIGTTTGSYQGNLVTVNTTNFPGTNGIATTTSPVTAGFPTKGVIGVATSTGQVSFSYSGITATGFQNCIILGGTTGGTLTGGGAINLPQLSAGGMVCNLHILTLTGNNGTNFPSLTCTVQESDDGGTTWVSLAAFSQTGTNTFSASALDAGTVGSPGSGGPITIVGGFTALVAYGTPISRALRLQVVSALNSAPSISATLVASVARQ